MAPDKSAKLPMRLQSLCGSSRRWNQKQRGDRKGGNSRVEAERQGGGGSLPGGKPRLETVSQLTVAAQRLSKDRGKEEEGAKRK